MNEIVRFFTDAATLVVFDPQVLQHRVDDEIAWWVAYSDFTPPEVASGDVAIVGLAGDGVYTLRVTDEGLTEDELDYASDMVELGLKVVSNAFFVGKGEAIPCGGRSIAPETVYDADEAAAGEGAFLPYPNGLYTLRVYDIAWFRSARWWTVERGVPADAPADYVAVISPRTEVFQLDRKPQLYGIPPSAIYDGTFRDAFLFDRPGCQIGPVVGMVLRTKVNKGRSGLFLQPCGPESYEVALDDYAGLKWGDDVEIRVVEVDHARRSMRGELIRKI